VPLAWRRHTLGLGWMSQYPWQETCLLEKREERAYRVRVWLVENGARVWCALPDPAPRRGL